jgi:phosphohistidine phosphatase
MARQLLLIRHAKSSRDDPSIPDHERPLSKRGRKAAAAIGKLMRSKGLVPDLVLVSSARRTTETLDALQPWDHHPPIVEVQEALYLASADRMLELLREVKKSARSVLLIAHNPGVQDLAVLLAGAHAGAAEETLARRVAEAFPTGALAEFRLTSPWSETGEGSARLVRFVIPRELGEGAAIG